MFASFAAILATTAMTGPFDIQMPTTHFDPAVALRKCRVVINELKVDFRGDGAPLLVQLRSCPEESPEVGSLTDILVVKDWPQPIIFAEDDGYFNVELTAIPAGHGEALLVQQAIGQMSVFGVFALHRGKITLLRPPDLSRGVRAGEFLDGDDVEPSGDLLVAKLALCHPPECDCCLPIPHWLVVKLRPDPERGVLRLVSLRRTGPKAEP